MIQIYKRLLLIIISFTSLFGNKVEFDFPTVILTGIENELQISIKDSTILPCTIKIEDEIYHVKSSNILHTHKYLLEY